MTRLPCALALSIVSALAGQAPVLDAAEVAAYRAARSWQQSLVSRISAANVATKSSWAPGFERLFFGFDRDGEAGVSLVDRFDHDWTTVAVFYPSRGSLQNQRLLMGNSLGHVFLGRPPVGKAEWRPRIASISAQGAPESLTNMLLQSGQALDGTSWRRVEALEEDVGKEQRVRFIRTDGGSFDGFEFTIGSSRFRWHPGWLPLEDGIALAQRGDLVASGEGEGEAIASGPAIPARGLQLEVRQGTSIVVLRPGDVRVVDGELLVSLLPDAMVEAPRLDDQAWAAEALRQFAEFELVARDRVKLDRDGDGRGEFGEPDEVVPQNRLGQMRQADGLWQFHNHFFSVHLPDTADDREQRFVAYAWPVQAVERRDLAQGPVPAVDPHDLAFAVDHRGVVFACSVHQLLPGRAKTPLTNALYDAELGWRPLH